MDTWFYAVLRCALNDPYRKSGRTRRLKDAVVLESETAEDTSDSAEAMRTVCKCVIKAVTELRAADADLIRRIDIDEEDRASSAKALNLSPTR